MAGRFIETHPIWVEVARKHDSERGWGREVIVDLGPKPACFSERGLARLITMLQKAQARNGHINWQLRQERKKKKR